jgi:hypothetical protein
LTHFEWRQRLSEDIHVTTTLTKPLPKTLLKMSAIHCFFCGGKECKYENWKLWLPDKGYMGVNAIDGLFSNWYESQQVVIL